jgi:hypothetical protein
MRMAWRKRWFVHDVGPRCGLIMLPKTGHTINLEEPAAFNAAVEEFIHAVERDAWGEGDPIAKEKYLLVPMRK